MELIVKFQKIHHHAFIPTKATDLSAGLDFYTLNSHYIGPFDRVMIGTGVAWEPIWRDSHGEYSPSTISNYVPYLQLFGRSGLAAKNGFDILAGVIDADYRGEIGFVLLNTTDRTYNFHAGDRIGQGVVLMTPKYNIEETKYVTQTERGTGGFGSTGV